MSTMNNDPDRAPGMRGFLFRSGEPITLEQAQDGEPFDLIWCGTIKAAIKKERLLRLNGRTST